MVTTIFEEKYRAGKTEGRSEGKADSIRNVLSARFHSVTPKVQKHLSSITDVSRLENLVGQAAVCPTLKDFEKLLCK